MTSPEIEPGAPGTERRTPAQGWRGVTDAAWWAAVLAAVIVASVGPRLVPADAPDLWRYAAGLPLGAFVCFVGYSRWRVRASWGRALLMGAGVALAILAVGWGKGRLWP